MSEMDRRYPVGRFAMTPNPTPEHRAAWLDEIARLPDQLRAAVASLPEGALEKPYREGGWTGRQVIHHLADSHINSYVRFRLALTEEKPVIKPYEETRWAELSDARSGPVEVSLALIEGLHARWVALLRSLSDADWARTFIHPELGERDLTTTLALYAWHGRHHLGHLELLR
ncbi:MAG: putative metal-dependent hydrolase [Bryobacteraceae bacterium]|nr:putative metal-dependent hydrolase [Bryobacteraceae bacterium]